MRSKVDLPEPEPPSRAKISPLLILMLTSSTATVSSKLFDTLRISTKTSLGFCMLASAFLYAPEGIAMYVSFMLEGVVFLRVAVNQIVSDGRDGWIAKTPQVHLTAMDGGNAVFAGAKNCPVGSVRPSMAAQALHPATPSASQALRGSQPFSGGIRGGFAALLSRVHLQIMQNLQATGDSSPAKPGHNPSTRSRQTLGRVGPESGLSGLGRFAGPNQRQPDAAPHQPRRHSAKPHTATAARQSRATILPPAQGNLWAGWGRSQALAVWAGLPDRTSVSRTQRPTRPSRRRAKLLARFDLGPATRHRPLPLGRQVREGIQLLQHLITGINTRVITVLLIHQWRCRAVGVGELQIVGQIRHHLRLQQVINEFMGLFDILRVSRNAHHIKESTGALLRDLILNPHLAGTLFGTRLALVNIAGITHRHTNVAIGQVRDVFGRMEIGNVRTHLQQQLFSLPDMPCIFAFRRQAQVMHGCWNHLGRRIQQSHTILGQLADFFRVENHLPAIHRLHTQRRFDLGWVITNTDRTPHIRYGVLIARIADFQGFQQILV